MRFFSSFFIFKAGFAAVGEEALEFLNFQGWSIIQPKSQPGFEFARLDQMDHLLERVRCRAEKN